MKRGYFFIYTKSLLLCEANRVSHLPRFTSFSSEICKSDTNKNAVLCCITYKIICMRLKYPLSLCTGEGNSINIKILRYGYRFCYSFSLSIVGEPQFVMTVEKVRKQAGFPFCCVLVGVRDLGFKR
uniref:Uncharacterized protein n=1 Tax=Microviridae sp. ctE3S2 TaxID=2824989 RepID=A0A8S5V873_9VIRU|nr:MAG TPA: hypothetical protein [Microviridae sp. ctE3S2]